jgi:hypothetical protein
MKIKATTRRLGRRRLATVLAAMGVLVMSSGAALLVTASPASAANKVGICHATSSDSNPYVFVSVDDDSVKFKGHLKHFTNPNKTWQNAGSFNGDPHTAGQLKPDIIGSYTDDQGVFHQMAGNVTAATCENQTPSLEAAADVDFEDPSCANQNTPSYETFGVHVDHFAITSGSVAPDTSIVVTAYAAANSTFAGGGTTLDFPWHFGDAVDLEGPPCVVVSPPGTSTASVSFTDPTCDNGNDASYTPSGDNVSFAVTSGSAAPGSSIEVTATADKGSEFADHTTSKVFTHTFGDAVNLDGDVCSPAAPSTPGTTVVTPTVVHSGLASDVRDLRGTQGMVLLGLGMIMLVFAGGLGLNRSKS